MFRKNTAGQYMGLVAINATTGATMTGTAGFAAYRVLDGGAQAAATGTVTDKGNGQLSFALSQADTNGNDCSILFTMTGMIAVEKTFVTTACDPTTATNFGITALPAVASGAAGAIITSGTGTAQLSVASGLVTLAPVTHTGAVIPTVTTLTNLPAITTDWLTGTGVAASAVTKIQSGLATPTNITAATGVVLSGIVHTGATIPTVTTTGTATTVGTVNALANNAITAASLAADAGAEIADAVWDEVLSGHLTGGTTGAGLNAAGGAGDPWSTALPGAYGVGTAGKILGTNLDALISSRATPTNITAGTITTVTNLTNLPAAPTDWLTAASVSATAVTKVQAGLATPTNITAGTITTVTNLTNAPTSGDLTAVMKASVTAACTASTPAATIGAGAISSASFTAGAINAAALNADAVAKIWEKAMVELAAVPAINDSVLAGLTWCFEASKHRFDQTSSVGTLFKDDNTTALATCSVSDNGITFQRGKYA